MSRPMLLASVWDLRAQSSLPRSPSAAACPGADPLVSVRRRANRPDAFPLFGPELGRLASAASASSRIRRPGFWSTRERGRTVGCATLPQRCTCRRSRPDLPRGSRSLSRRSGSSSRTVTGSWTVTGAGRHMVRPAWPRQLHHTHHSCRGSEAATGTGSTQPHVRGWKWIVLTTQRAVCARGSRSTTDPASMRTVEKRERGPLLPDRCAPSVMADGPRHGASREQGQGEANQSSRRGASTHETQSSGHRCVKAGPLRGPRRGFYRGNSTGAAGTDTVARIDGGRGDALVAVVGAPRAKPGECCGCGARRLTCAIWAPAPRGRLQRCHPRVSRTTANPPA